MWDKSWSFEFPLGFPDIREWKAHYFNRTNEEQKTLITGKDFIGLYFNMSRAHEYRVPGHSQYVIEPGQYNFVFIPKGEAQLTIPKGLYSSFCIEFTPVLLNKIKELFPLLERLLKCVDRKIPFIMSNVNMTITSNMYDAIREILGNKHDLHGALKEILNHSKVISLLFSSLKNIKTLSESHLRPNEIEKVFKVHDYLLEHLKGNFLVEQLADMVDMERRKLEKAFKAIYGTGVYRFFLNEKLRRAALLLRDTTLPVKQIAREVGFNSFARFTEAFKKHYGFPPSDFRKLDD